MSLRSRVRDLEQLRAYEEGKRAATTDPADLTALTERVLRLETLLARLLSTQMFKSSTENGKEGGGNYA